jgi:putative spermidine/putrescine transport system permease protein
MFTGGGAMQQQIAGGQVGAAATDARTASGNRVGRLRGGSWSYTLTSWLGLVPFLLFCLLFELLPALIIVFGSLSDSNSGALTLNNYQRMLSQAQNIHAFETSIALSLVTALIGAIFGFLASYGVYNLRTGALRNFIVGFSSIAANFAGVPLAFAFVATLGAEGFITVLIHNWFHVNLYDVGFSLYTFWGLVLVYTYFQLPLMILVTVPALSALRPEWREAATNLGASSFTYWRRIALPILMPSLIAAAMLLFANSFGAYATAYALAQGAINIVPILIGYAVAGNVSMDVGLGNALAVGMIVVLLIAVSLYTTMVRRANTWTGR